MCVLETCARLGEDCLVSRAHDGFTSSPQARLTRAQSEPPYTAVPFSVWPNPTATPPDPSLNPPLVSQHTAHRPHSGSWTPIWASRQMVFGLRLHEGVEGRTALTTQPVCGPQTGSLLVPAACLPGSGEDPGL